MQTITHRDLLAVVVQQQRRVRAGQLGGGHGDRTKAATKAALARRSDASVTWNRRRVSQTSSELLACSLVPDKSLARAAIIAGMALQATARPLSGCATKCASQRDVRASSPRAAAPGAPSRRCRAHASRLRCAASAQRAEASGGDVASAKGRMTYRPASYAVIVADAVRALQAAMRDGERLLEVEFPPLPSSMDGALLGCKRAAPQGFASRQRARAVRVLTRHARSLQRQQRRVHRRQLAAGACSGQAGTRGDTLRLCTLLHPPQCR